MTSLSDSVYYPISRENPLHPPAHCRALQQLSVISKVVLWNGNSVWLITKHADARTVLRDKRFSADATLPGFPTFSAGRPQGRDRRTSISRMDDPRHSELRSMIAHEFTAKRGEDWRVRIREIVDEQLSQIVKLEQPVDLVSRLSFPVPSLVICDLLGIPRDDRRLFQELTNRLVSHTGPAGDALAADREMFSYLDGLISVKEQTRPNDLFGDLIRSRFDQGLISHDETVNLARLLLVAGHETTANVISLGILTLIQHRKVFEGLAEGIISANSVALEVLRFHTVLHNGLPRIALDDVAVGGTLIKAGDGVVVAIATANRDEEVFQDPDVFTPGRNCQQQLSFGYGPHRCIGQWLALAEIEETLQALTIRLPGLRAQKPSGDPYTFRGSKSVYGLEELFVSW